MEKRVTIVLIERVEHLKILRKSLKDLDVPVLIYKEYMSKSEIKKLKML